MQPFSFSFLTGLLSGMFFCVYYIEKRKKAINLWLRFMKKSLTSAYAAVRDLFLSDVVRSDCFVKDSSMPLRQLFPN